MEMWLKTCLVHCLFQVSFVCCIINPNQGGQVSSGSKTLTGSPPVANIKQMRWANGAFDYINNLDCNQTFFTSESECDRLRTLSKADFVVYIADPTSDGRLRTVIPDDDLDHNDVHDAVLVLDPYPLTNLGHLVLVFYVDVYAPKNWCEKDHGVVLRGGECMTLALKRRCRQVLERKIRTKRNYARKCEINMIPLVHLDVSNDYSAPQQRLSCRSNVPGFKRCPEFVPTNDTVNKLCGPLQDNSKNCETAAQHIHTSCRVFEICDQAVIITGGWNRLSLRARFKETTWDFYHMLKLHGFIDRNIKVFYANGDRNGIPKEGRHEPHEVFPAAYKSSLRGHLQKVCSLPHCADSLVVYINGVSTADGTTLLWDINQDGIADDEEVYKVEEFLGDIANCHANQVHVIIDQSFSGAIARGARRSHNHRNVAVYASSKDHEYSRGSEFTRFWTKTNHTTKCMKENFKFARNHMDHSTPDLHLGEQVGSRNLFGAPCDVAPPFSWDELQKDYLGCQNLPTSVWFKSSQASAELSFIGPVKAKVESPSSVERRRQQQHHRGRNRGKSREKSN